MAAAVISPTAPESPSPKTMVLAGAQWGDEGKGKVVDFLINHHKFDVVARFQGGHNAGHTVIVNGHKYIFRLLPSGTATPHAVNVIGNGCVVNVEHFFEELAINKIPELFPDWASRFKMSDRAQLIFKVHAEVDAANEQERGKKMKLGTTLNGIGPAYVNKAARNGLRVGDLLGNFNIFTKRYLAINDFWQRTYPDIEVDTTAEILCLELLRERLKDLNIVCDTSLYLHRAIKSGLKVFFEGAQGVMLDLDHGNYPVATSNNTTSGGACTGLGVPIRSVGDVVGVVKAYQTRYGRAPGPFPTEQLNDVGRRIITEGGEVSVYESWLDRRVGWLDLFLLRSSAIVNGFTCFALTKIDIFDKFDEIKVGIGYTKNGVPLEAPPVCNKDFDDIRVEYATLPGWLSDTTTIRDYAELPQKAKDFVEYVEKYVGVPVKYVSVGPERDAVIVR
uniref:Adenylosuccinate synthetase n=1 Tax=Panagrellus redivivus TaxID=6233 RepID=A0A7E4ZRU4_PANRE